VLVLNAGLMVAEIIGGIAFGSLALLADAVHMVSDVTGLVIAMVAQRLMSRGPSPRHSYGLQRSEVLAAQVNAAILLAAAAWVIVEAIRRIGAPPHIEAGGMLVVASLGLAVNTASIVILARSRSESLNMRAAFVHMSADAAGSVGVVVAGVAALGSVLWVDPSVSLLLGVLIVFSGSRLLLESTHILMEGTPRDLDPDEIATAIATIDGVESVHHLHVWHLASDTVALSAHIVAAGEPSLEEAQSIGNEVRSRISDRFGISHTTLELENDSCI
jgi:cobalt-zinc-cadmium efflux system protein